MRTVVEITLGSIRGIFGGPVAVIKNLFKERDKFKQKGLYLRVLGLKSSSHIKRYVNPALKSPTFYKNIKKLVRTKLIYDSVLSLSTLVNQILLPKTMVRNTRILEILNNADLIHTHDPFSFFALLSSDIDPSKIVLTIHSPGAVTRERMSSSLLGMYRTMSLLCNFKVY